MSKIQKDIRRKISMRTIKLLATLATVLLATTLMSAQASRTWVSGVGDDANPCSRTAPCKTWAGAISKTAPGGEIDALDPGGFGALTITKAITLDGGGGQVASTLVAGTNGIVVQANAASDTVIIRNLRINGISGTGNGGFNGIRFLSGKDLNVENCYIFGFTQNGIDIALNQANQASVHVVNTVLKNNGGDGLRATNAVSPAVRVEVIHSYALLNGSVGFEAQQHSRIVAFQSHAEHGTDGFKADDLGGTNDAQIIVSNSEASFNTNVVRSADGGTVQVGGSVASFNSSCGFNGTGGGNIFFYQQTNRVVNNSGGATPGVSPGLLCGATTGIPQT